MMFFSASSLFMFHVSTLDSVSVCGYPEVCIEYLIDKTIFFSADSTSFAIQVPSFSIYPFGFLFSQIIPFYGLSSLPNWNSYSYFNAISPINFYAIIKCLASYSDVELSFSDSVRLFITLLKLSLAFLFHV